MIKIFKKGLTASEGCRWGLSGSWYGCWRRAFFWRFLETEGRKRKRRGSIKSEKKEPAQSFGGCAGFDVRNSAGEDTEDSIRPSAVRGVTEKNRLGDAAWMRKSKEGKVVLIRKRDGVAEGTHLCWLKTGLG